MLIIASPTSRRAAGATALALATAVALSGCGGSSTAEAPPAAAASTSSAAPMGPQAATGTAAASVPAGSHLGPRAFAAAASRPGTVILDVRTAEEFAAGHLPGAMNADVESPGFAAALDGLDPSLSYAVYCHSGRRSGIALDEMSQAGFTDAYDLAGGISAWVGSGGHVVRP
jgi:phage shock protein E